MLGGSGQSAAAPVGIVEEAWVGDEGDGAFGPEADFGRGEVGVGDDDEVFDFVAGFGGVVAANCVADDQVEETKEILSLRTFG